MGKQILVIGAGKSATVLIDFLQKKLVENNWFMVLADADAHLAAKKWNNAPNGHSVGMDILQQDQRVDLIKNADLVISMLPAFLHVEVAKDCLSLGKALFTASYVDEQMQSISKEIKQKGLLFLCEMGLDPGIDHMSAMELIDRIKSKNGQITGFKSHCGGLIAPESDTNPWHYKISWNPRNIILAGKAGAIYLENGIERSIEYHSIFENCAQINVPNWGQLSYYPNRDSLSYINTYQLEGVQDFIRTTLRHPMFTDGWNAIVQMGFTSEELFDKPFNTIADWFQHQIHSTQVKSIWDSIQQNSLIKNQFDFLALEVNDAIPATCTSNASVLQWILETKWALGKTDKDAVVMMHEVDYILEGKKYSVQSSLVLTGKNHEHTAMASTVGLPLGIAAEAYLKGQLNITGLHIPTIPELYQPILSKLKEEGIEFYEETVGSHS
jgi:saccharopine dehydrogenase-like NADP-dependent oxidoreductase